ncbi:hypothetical protein ACJJTC_018782 [Scirpophaga incertulas]
MFTLNNLEISGIPISKGENLNTILHTVCNKVGFTLKETDIDTIHRVRRFSSGNDAKQRDSRPPAIIVSFTQRRRKDELLACVPRAAGSAPPMDCKIMMRKNDTSKFIRITNENDLLSLK